MFKRTPIITAIAASFFLCATAFSASAQNTQSQSNDPTQSPSAREKGAQPDYDQANDHTRPKGPAQEAVIDPTRC